MYFERPEVLWGLFALVVPLLIHLFSFRKQRTLYFSTLRFLQEAQNQQKKHSRLKDWWILLMRMMALTLLLLAFASPRSKSDQETGSGIKKAVGLFIDNSASMTALGNRITLFDQVRQQAIGFIERSAPDQMFILGSNSQNPVEFGIVNKEEAREILQRFEINAIPFNLKLAMGQFDYFSESQNLGITPIYLFSDFQKSGVQEKIDVAYQNITTHLIRAHSSSYDNLSADSCWLEQPILQSGQKQSLFIRITNHGDQDYQDIPVTLELNGMVSGITQIDIPANSSKECSILIEPQTMNWVRGKISITDFPVTFDNTLYLTFKPAQEQRILYLYGENLPNEHLISAFELINWFKTDVFYAEGYPGSSFEDYDFIVLEHPERISPSMLDMMEQYLNSEGQIWLIPGIVRQSDDYRKLHEIFDLPLIVRTSPLAVRAAIPENRQSWFKSVVINASSRLELPTFNQTFQTIRKNTDFVSLLSSEGGESLISRYSITNGFFYWSSFSLTDSTTNFSVHPIFVPMVLDLATFSINSASLYRNILTTNILVPDQAGVDQNESMYFANTLRSDNTTVFKSMRGRQPSLLLDPSDIPVPGHYTLFTERDTLQ